MRLTVKQLIEKLSQLDQNAFVFVNGYEEGLDDIYSIDETPVLLDVNEEHWQGRHERVKPNGQRSQMNIVNGVVLRREHYTN